MTLRIYNEKGELVTSDSTIQATLKSILTQLETSESTSGASQEALDGILEQLQQFTHKV